MTKRLIAFGVLSLLVGCGDDTGTGTTTSSSGQGGATTTTSTASGGAGGGQRGRVGDPCTSDLDCPGGLCLDEAASGEPGGYCSRRCEPSVPDQGCPEGVCAEVSTFGDVCLLGCDPAAPSCRDAYLCRPSQISETDWACRSACSDDAQCPVTGNCAPTVVGRTVVSGGCVFPESACTNLRDDDGDKLADCSDPDCSADSACVGGPAAFGDPCESYTDCEVGTFCASEAALGFPNGMCIRSEGDGCPPGESLDYAFYSLAGVPGQGLYLHCAPACLSSADCRTGYGCTSGACRPKCAVAADCASGICFTPSGLCAQAEACQDGYDNDKNGQTDCQDTACSAACSDAFATECMAALPMPTSPTDFGTSTGQQSVCGGPGGALDFFVFTAPAAGDLVVTLDAPTPHILGRYSSCVMPTSGLQCTGSLYSYSGAFDRSYPVSQGQTIYVSVGTAAELVGPYTLSSLFTPN